MKEQDISNLIEKYKKGQLSPEESDFLDAWYIKNAQDKSSSFNPETLDRNLEQLWASVSSDLSKNGFQNQPPNPKKASLFPRIAAAACLLLVTGIAFYSYQKTKSLSEIKLVQHIAPIKPGGNKAFLTLADGSRISLNDAKNGQLVNQAGISITKTKNGELVYSIANQDNAANGNTYNTIETPKGGQYQINLPDGSKVWLNAATTLKFPVAFTNVKQRKVELSGEAYFEIAKNPKLPFIVKTQQQQVEVLGTHFNLSSYKDDSATKTTLLEGSVRVAAVKVTSSKNSSAKNQVTLVPGQQSETTTGSINVKNVDTEEAIAWKNGQFMFKNEPLKEVMKKISRWYNVTIDYNGSFSDIAIGGSVSKFTNLQEVLDVLELTAKIKFKVEANKITVSRKPG